MEALAFENGPHPGVRSKVRALAHATRNIVPEPVPIQALEQDPLDSLRLAAVDLFRTYVVDQLRDATDADELVDVLDALLVDDEFRRRRDRVVAFFSMEGGLDALVEAKGSPVPDYLKRLVAGNAELSALIERGHRLEIAHMIAQLQWLAHKAATKQTAEPSEDKSSETKPPLWFLEEPGVPVDCKRIWLARERADVCQDGLFVSGLRELLNEEPLPAWMIERLIRMWVDGAQAYLGFICALPGVSRPDSSLVLPHEIEATRKAAQVHIAAERGYQERLKAARATDGWYPEPEPEDGG